MTESQTYTQDEIQELLDALRQKQALIQQQQNELNRWQKLNTELQKEQQENSEKQRQLNDREERLNSREEKLSSVSTDLKAKESAITERAASIGKAVAAATKDKADQLDQDMARYKKRTKLLYAVPPAVVFTAAAEISRCTGLAAQADDWRGIIRTAMNGSTGAVVTVCIVAAVCTAIVLICRDMYTYDPPTTALLVYWLSVIATVGVWCSYPAVLVRHPAVDLLICVLVITMIGWHAVKRRY